MSYVLEEPSRFLSDKSRWLSLGDASTSLTFEQGVLSKRGANAWQPITPPQTLIWQVGGTEVRIADAPDPIPEWFYRTLRAVVHSLSLEPGWDSYDANPVSRSAAETGLARLFDVMQPSSPPPTVAPIPDGGLQFEWHRNGLDVEIELSRDGVARFVVADLSLDSEIEADWSDLSRLQEAIARLSD